MRFAPHELADLFAAERNGDVETSLGYHGVWNMPRVVGIDSFWEVYRSLDDRGTVRHDFWSMLMEVRYGRGGSLRMAQMILDHLKAKSGMSLSIIGRKA